MTVATKPIVRNLFHYEGMTDLRAMRAEAERARDHGELVVLHHHPYHEQWDGCYYTADETRRLDDIWEAGDPHEVWKPREEEG